MTGATGLPGFPFTGAIGPPGADVAVAVAPGAVEVGVAAAYNCQFRSHFKSNFLILIE